MKIRIIALGVMVSTVGMCMGAADAPNFEFWNKTKGTLHVRYGSELSKSGARYNLSSKKLVPYSADRYMSDQIGDNDKFVAVQFSKSSTGAREAYMIERKSIERDNKTVYETVYVRVKESKGKLLFGPQTGPFGGLRGKTERGYSLKNNVTSSNIDPD